MKNLIQILVSLSILCSIGQLSAQESDYVRQPGYWTLGLNGGLAYQSSDVRATLDGWGVGATLAKNLYYKPGAPLTFDLRGRLLYDQSYGLDHFRSYGIANNPALEGYRIENGGDGFVFQNNKTHHGELGLEGVIGFNRLREKTNINLALFGGIGLDYYGTYVDQKNSNNTVYDYNNSDIDLSANRQTIKAQLSNQLDGRYETKAEGFGDAGKLAFMPAVGVELGYQLTPRFSIGVGHKLTFTRTDLFDGQQWNDDNRVTANNDLHHYTNLHLRWIIDSEKGKIKPPVIELLTPMSNPHTTTNPLALVKARIKHINSPMDVDYVVNGRQAQFDFRKENLTNDFYLRPGRNEIDITATNTAGSDQERVIIYYTEPDIKDPPPSTDLRKPRVNFTNPSRNPEYVYTDRYSVTATVLNVDRKRDIDFEVNGRNVSDFEFDSRTDRFSSNIRLNVGENRLRITVRNADGMTDRDDATIVLERQQIDEQRPVVKITSPTNDPYRTTESSARIRADIFNVSEKLDVTFEVNGKRVRNFNFSNSKFSGTANLDEGRNTVMITGRNKAGQDSDQITIYYDLTPSIDPPVVKITSVSQPTSDPFNPDQCKVNVKADIRNIANKDDITFLLDGKRFYDFSYNANTNILSSVVTINTGNHDVVIKASNIAGTDQDEAAINSCNSTTTGGDAPEVKITSPRDGSTTNEATATIKATLKRVDRKSDITFIVNGKRLSKFNYKTDQGIFAATITLIEGNNTVEVIGKNRYGSDNDEISIRYRKIADVSKRPPVITISQPRNNSTVSDNTTNLEAVIENVFEKKDINVTLNGRKVKRFDFASRGGRLTATINGLIEGNNTLKIEASNKDGEDQASVNVTYKKVAIPLPTVKITTPRNGLETTESSVAVKATITGVDSNREITFKVNGRSVSDFSFSRGLLTATVSLRKGRNNIFVEGRNTSGKADDEVSVIFKEAMLPPRVSITSPRNGAITDQSSVVVEAAINGVDNKRDLTLKVNGRSVSKFSYSKGLLSATVKLQTGSNNIFVEGRNESGKADDEVAVTYKKLTAPPKVNITSPRNGTTTDQSSTTVKATITGVAHKRDVTLKVNGRSVSKFSYSKGLLSATVNLKTGSNNISIEGRNESGKADDKVSVTYKKAVAAPKVDITSPRNGTELTKPSAAISASITGVDDKKGVTLTVNGKSISSFIYKRGKLTATIPLKVGKNQISVKGQNETGTDSDAITVTHKVAEVPKNPPTISSFSLSQPTVDPLNPNTARSNVNATLGNISKKSQIKFYLNGRASSAFTFDRKSKKLKALITLKKGVNYIKIVATNADGQKEKTKEITF